MRKKEEGQRKSKEKEWIQLQRREGMRGVERLSRKSFA
jgi:hypothetical protein